MELSRKNVIRRDGGKCQYCGKAANPLTVDHIMPRSRGGEDTWENLTTACMYCNNKKGDRTPEEARMPLLNKPKRPSRAMFLRQMDGIMDDTWRPYLFMD